MLIRSGKFIKAILLLLDLTALLLSFFMATGLRFGESFSSMVLNDYYSRTLWVVSLIYLLIWFLYDSGKGNVTERGLFANFTSVFQNILYTLIITLIYFFATQQGILVSRYVIGVFFAIFFVTDYLFRILWRAFLIRVAGSETNATNIMLVTLSADAPQVINRFLSEKGTLQHISCVTLLDADKVGEEIEGIPIVGNSENYLDTHRVNVYDEVFIFLPYDYEIELKKLISGFEEMGVAVNLYIEVFDLDSREKSVRTICGYHVVSFMTRRLTAGELFIKRMIDIAGALVGLVIFAAAYIIIAPIIRFTSPGPVIFTQTRVGINGRRFKLYKFRSMYQDAEKRKAELMKQNQMQGNMFKLKDDPRITPVGKFIRRTSIDELPQFINVLAGDMSLVGTRPPTEDEYEKYKNYHMRRLSMKPGITGMWQVSGRSDITDFEQVVRLDLEYIDNWSLLLDIQLILRTFKVVFLSKGAR
ncbi:MAG: sugar transferase [Lachnospiraceae bacterium]|nr:sugar transferase [Lachnospiraceae bacterium]